MISLEVFSKDELLLDFSEMEHREFGFVFSGKFKRKMQFDTKEKLIRLLDMVKPKDCFVSNARYLDPCHMDGFLGCDFFIDIDNDVLSVAYSDTLSAIKVLERDFGFKKLIMNKSGCKGYHIVISDECVQDLSSGERDEMVQYLQIKYKAESIDAPCTCDIHRLRRLEGTINSKSGNHCKRLITKGFDE